jgi:3-dehydroquinate synthetase
LPAVNVSSPKILSRLKADKKTENGVVHFVLPVEIGKVEIFNAVPESAVLEAVDQLRRLSRGGWVGKK